MVTPVNLQFEHPEVPKYLGKINGTQQFDAQFFRVTYYQAISMEPMSRKLLESAYSAMFDAGEINFLKLFKYSLRTDLRFDGDALVYNEGVPIQVYFIVSGQQ